MVSTTGERAPGGVQSVHRALDLLDAVAAGAAPAPLADLAARTGLALPTAHRLAATLVERGYLRRLPDRRYALGFRLVPLGAAAGALAGTDTHDVLRALVDDLGETANLALLAGDRAEYVAQAPSRYAMRMFTEVGRRVELHCTGVGKALLSQLPPEDVEALARRAALTRHTEHTITDPTDLVAEVARVRERGWAVDEQEQEVGVRCVAVPVPLGGLAVSVSGPLTRMGDETLARAVPLLRHAADTLSRRLRQPVDPGPRSDDGGPTTRPGGNA